MPMDAPSEQVTPPEARILTVGHGTLGADELVDVLRVAGVGEILDVRRFPGSRRHPHVGTEAMAGWLGAAGVGYRWLPDLGGRRTPSPESPNVGLRNPQFRAYADHMGTDEFAAAEQVVIERAAIARVAVLCAESVWWRCHRRLLADHLVLLRGEPVAHLFHDGRLAPHPPMPGAEVGDGRLVYR